MNWKSPRQLQLAFPEMEPGNPIYTYAKDAIGLVRSKKPRLNSRTLSINLRCFKKRLYNRDVTAGPPLRVEYSLTSKEKHCTVCFALLIFSSVNLRFQ
jgi:hypothetical protein